MKMQTNEKPEMAILTPDRMDFEPKAMTGDEEAPAAPLPGIYLKKPRTLLGRDVCTHMLTVASLTVAEIWRPPGCPPAGEWIETRRCVYTEE